MSLSTGTRLGPYEILTPLGAGGMGEVYKARDTRLDRTIAIKVLPEHLSQKPQLRERFEREARAVSSLNHSNICTLHDVGQQDDVDYLVMEYLEGDTLAQRLKKGPLPLDQTLRYAVEIAGALDHAHRHGVVHRDLKPGNIMLTKAGAKVLDFGLAKVLASAGTPGVSQPTNTMTEEGVILGTLQYMAPEQLECKEADSRTDIFAFGAVVYEMITGKKAFEGKGRASVIAAILEREPPPISSLQSLTPPALDHVVRSCLAKDPDARKQNAHDVMLELKWIVDGGFGAAGPALVVAHRRNWERLVWAGATAISLGIAATLVIVHFRQSPPAVKEIHFAVSAPEKVSFSDASTISPDGTRLALVVNAAGGRSSLWVRRLDSVVAQALPGTEGAEGPFWSPDSRFIAYFAQGSLKKIDLGGGPAQTLSDAPGGGAHGAWNRDGVIVFDATRPGPLYRVSAEGGRATPVTALDRSRQENFHEYAQFLPDGRHFLYLAFCAGYFQNDAIYVGSLDSTERKFLVSTHWMAAYAPDQYGQRGYLLFVREGTLVAQRFDADRLQLSGEPLPLAEKVTDPNPASTARFSVSANGVLAYWQPVAFDTQLVWLDRGGKRLGAIGAPGQYYNAALSPDMNRIALLRQDQTGNGNIWLMNLDRGGTSRFTFSSPLDNSPVWSPDGSRIAFASNRAGNFDLYEKPSSGLGSEETLWKSNEAKFPTDWSHDGRFIAYSAGGQKTRSDIWILPLQGERKPFPFLQTDFDELDARFSPDGRWIAYRSYETGRGEVYVKPFAGTPIEASRSAGKWQISTNGGAGPRWRGDGKELFYTEGNSMMAVEVTSGSAFEAGVPRKLFELPPGSAIFGQPLTADGQRFLVNAPSGEEKPQPIMVIVNWQAGLKK